MERKLTAIVAADVVDYSVFLGENEIATIAALYAMQKDVLSPLTSKYDGRIVRLMGDGSLFAFNSAFDAVQFAVSTQRMMSERKTNSGQLPIELRMGINLCDVILEEHDIHGEGLNIAVRLEELAPPGGICLSHSIYLQTKSVLSGQILPIGERHLKNISEPVQVWRWQPSNSSNAISINTNASRKKRHFHGRQILDPKITTILIDMYMQSICLAISDCFDEILANSENGHIMPVEEIYKKFGNHVAHAHGLLQDISIEFVDNIHEFTPGLWQSPQSMSIFFANIIDNMSYTAGFLAQIREILQSNSDTRGKRKEGTNRVRTFVRNELSPKIKPMIKFAFVEP
jgi:class 3 adenylate cyclase